MTHSTVPAAFEIDHTLTADAPLPQSVAAEPTSAPVVDQPPAKPPLKGATIDACAIATGEATDPDANAISITAAKKDYNSRGKCREHWFRMVWRAGSWIYFSDERLPNGTFLGSDRCATVDGDVYPGEIVCQHDRGGQVDGMWLIRAYETPRVKLEWTRTRSGLRVQLPTGAMLTLPDPRKK